MSRNFYLCLLSVILSFTSCAFAKYVQGDIISNDDWMYLSKFCYSTAGIGNLTWQAWSEDDSHLMIVFYDDVPTSWDAVYPHRDELSCWEKVAMAKGNRTLRTGVMDFQLFADYERPHYWYAAIANCGGSGKMDLQFDLHWTNYGGLWSKELSYDAQGVPETYLFFWLLFMIGIVIHARCIWVLMQQASYHPIVKLLTATIVLEALYQLCMFIHFAVYIHDGVGAPGLSGLGEMLGMIAQLVFMFLLLLLAKGWAITKTEVSDKKIMIVGIAIFLLAYITLFIWQNVGEDPASTLYVFESAPGIIVLVLRCIALLWFLWCLRSTHLDETTPEKKRFYFIFGIAYTIWWAALPFFVLLSIGFSAWYRFKVVTALFLCVNTLGIFGLAFLLWPSRARAYFQITRTDLLLGNKSSPYETL